MKNLLLSAIMLCAVVTFSQAQDRPNRQGGMRSPEERAKMMVERMDKELKLTPAQKDSITKWSLATSKEQQSIFKDEAGSREEKMEKMTKLRQAQSAKVKAILTPEQAAKFDEMSKKMGQRGDRTKSKDTNKSKNK